MPIDYVIETGSLFVNHQILPDEGGWNQQERRWVDVMQRVYLPGLSRAKYDALSPEEKKKYHQSLEIEAGDYE